MMAKPQQSFRLTLCTKTYYWSHVSDQWFHITVKVSALTFIWKMSL